MRDVIGWVATVGGWGLILYLVVAMFFPDAGDNHGV